MAQSTRCSLGEGGELRLGKRWPLEILRSLEKKKLSGFATIAWYCWRHACVDSTLRILFSASWVSATAIGSPPFFLKPRVTDPRSSLRIFTPTVRRFPERSLEICYENVCDGSRAIGSTSLLRDASRRGETYRAKYRAAKGREKRARYFGGYARGPCRAIKLRNGGSPLDVWRELHSLVKASRNSRRYRHRRGYINVSSYVLTAYSSPRPFFNLFSLSLSLARSLSSNLPVCLMYTVWCVCTHLHHRLGTYAAFSPCT